MANRADKMYGNSPKLKRDESGKVGISKDAAKASVENSGTKGVEAGGKEDGMPSHARHSLERNQLFSKFEVEHAASDYGSKGDKTEMYDRHAKEFKDLYKKHSKEMSPGMAAASKETNMVKVEETTGEAKKSDNKKGE